MLFLVYAPVTSVLLLCYFPYLNCVFFLKLCMRWSWTCFDGATHSFVNNTDLFYRMYCMHYGVVGSGARWLMVHWLQNTEFLILRCSKYIDCTFDVDLLLRNMQIVILLCLPYWFALSFLINRVSLIIFFNSIKTQIYYVTTITTYFFFLAVLAIF